MYCLHWAKANSPESLSPVYGELLISSTIPRVCRSGYNARMRDLVILFVHVIATLARLLGPGGHGRRGMTLTPLWLHAVDQL